MMRGRAYKRLAGWAKGALRRAGFIVRRDMASRHHRDYAVDVQEFIAADPERFYRGLAANRAALHAVDWRLSEAALDGALFRYGLPVGTRYWRNEENATYTDLLLFVLDLFPAPAAYLEIGVSIGKNLVPLAANARAARLAGLEIEAPSPFVEALFAERDPPDEWPADITDRHGRPVDKPAALHWGRAANGTPLVYAEASLFEAETWRRLGAQGRFQVVLSDAVHRPAAIRAETGHMLAHSLIDLDDFFIVWDDIDVRTVDGFLDCAAQLADACRARGRTPRFGFVTVFGTYAAERTPHHLAFVNGLAPSNPLAEVGHPMREIGG